MLRITQDFVAIGIKSTPSKMEIQQTPATLEINSGDAKVTIQQRPGKLDISWTKTFEALYIYTPRAYTRKRNNDGRRDVLEGIAQCVQEGLMLRDVHKNGVIVSKISAKKAWERPSGIKFDTLPLPQITYTEGSVDIQSSAEEPQIYFIPAKVDVNAVKSNLQVYLRQEPFIDVEWIGSLIDTHK